MKYITQKNESQKPTIFHESKSSKLLDDEVMDSFLEENPWGLNVSINLYECDPKLIRDLKYVRSFIKEIVVFIKMKAFGDPIIVDFGTNIKVSGISAIQLIETSNITAHFANLTNTAYIDVFSCKCFRPHETALFCKEYFKANRMKLSPVVFRY